MEWPSPLNEVASDSRATVAAEGGRPSLEDLNRYLRMVDCKSIIQYSHELDTGYELNQICVMKQQKETAHTLSIIHHTE